MDEVEAIHRCQRGDMDGLEPLIARHQTQALRLAYLLTGDWGLAEDITQDSFIQAFRSMHRFTEGRPLAPWLYRIVTNMARERMRARRRLREVNLDAHALDDDKGGAGIANITDIARIAHASEVDPATYAEQAEERDALFQALSALTQKQREAIILRYYLGYGDHECATIAGCREGAFRVRLHGALQALKRIIHQRYPWLLPTNSSSSDMWEVIRHVAL
ncbi:MAG TPA: RNA polymerase sigma factor [Ktedonobacterales bacterium]|nr:RNA polymerase sigma factor [Ktedonobacterales bacterium]